MRLWMVLALLLGAAGWAAELQYMDLFSPAERARPHVTLHSYTLPHDFVDGQWEGIIAASDGKTYFSVSCHGSHNNAQFYCYDPKTDAVTHLIDVAAWCGETENVGTFNTQGKIHSTIYEAGGKLYCSTTTAHTDPVRPPKGGYFLSYDLKKKKFAALAQFPDTGGGLLTMLYEPVYKRLYAISQTNQTLCYYDLKTKKVVTLGSVEDNPMQCRVLISDAAGNVYGSTWGGRIYRYNPQANELSVLLTELPADPQIRQPVFNAKDRGWMTTHWVNMMWDPQTKWWYGIKGNDEYLFRFRPPAPGSHRAAVQGLANLSFRPYDGVEHYGSLGMCRMGRTIYYCSYPIWRSMAHLMSYHIDTGTVTDHGPIVAEGHRRVSEIHSLVPGSDGKLHAVAMIWSINGQDPAQPWANRAGCYFHARFVTIDPHTDFKAGTP